MLISLILVWPHMAASATGKLPQSVESLLKKNGISQSHVSVVVEEINTAQPIIAVNPSEPRNPASVIKLVTTLSALELLGPTYQWHTDYLIDGQVKGKTLEGNLILKGGGDPFVTVDRFWSHILAIRERGISHINGNLIIDNTLFNIPPHDRGAFDGQSQRLYNVGADAALTNFSATRFVIEPGTGEDNQPIHVFADPPLADLEIKNSLKAAQGKCVSRNSGWSMGLNRKDGKIIAHFKGKYRPRCGAHSVSRSIVSNHEYAYRLFRYLWESMGGEFKGGYRTGATPETARQWVSIPSRSLAENIASINKFSNNVMARQLLLTIGHEWTIDSNKDTRQSGVEAILEWFDHSGISTKGVVIDNGAGLSRSSRISASQINDVLRLGWHSNWQPEFMASLSLAALDGTMRKRLKDSDLQGRARIKTGLINGIRSMAGFVHSTNNKHYIVTMMIDSDKVNYWNGNQIQDALLQWVYER